MDMMVSFPGNRKVDVQYGPFTIKTDQAEMAGGDGSAPEPFAYFLASLAACAGIYVLSFCQRRGIPTENVRIAQRLEPSDEGGIGAIHLDIEVPPEFPEQYRDALVRAASGCAVKKFIEHPAPILTRTVVR